MLLLSALELGDSIAQSQSNRKWHLGACGCTCPDSDNHLTSVVRGRPEYGGGLQTNGSPSVFDDHASSPAFRNCHFVSLGC